MKSFKDLKLRSKLPSHIKTDAKRIEGWVKNCEEFMVEQTEFCMLRFIWVIRNERGDKQIAHYIEFELAPSLAAEIMRLNNPEGAI